MKKSIIVIILCVLVQLVSAQEKQKKEIKTSSFRVEGNCEQCKKRIENAAYIKGVKSSSWDEKSKMLTVIYRADKISELQIQEAVAKSGHQTEMVPVDKSAYSKLPDCCKYQEKECSSKK